MEIEIVFKPEHNSLDALDELRELSNTLRGLNVTLVCYYQPEISKWAKAQWEKYGHDFLKRVVVRCTEEQYNSEDKNPYASGIFWEKLPG